MEENSRKPLLIYLITKATLGGAQHYVEVLSHAFAQEYDVLVACGEEGTLSRRLKEGGIRTKHIPEITNDLRIGASVRAVRALTELFASEKPAIIHINSSKAGLTGTFAARILNLYPKTYTLKPKIIFTAHGWAFNERRNAIVRILLWIAQWLTVLLSHRVIAVSEAIKKQTRAMPFVSARKVAIIPHGIKHFQPLPREQAQETLGLAHTTSQVFRFGTIAELHPNKGLRYAIDATAELIREGYDVSFTIIGDGKERTALEQRIHRHGIENSVRLVGRVPNARKLLSAFDCFLLPSATEALGYVLLEAGAAGIPVIAARVGGIPEIVINEKTGLLVPACDAHALADVMKQMIENDALRTTLARALSRRVENSFSLRAEIEKTRALYSA